MSAGIMFLCGDKTLILKRSNHKNDYYSGFWNFPGGQGEPDESPYRTAIRETFEETGIGLGQYRIINHIESRACYTLYLALIDEEIKPVLDHEHTDWRWVPVDKLSYLKDKLHPKDWPYPAFFQ